MDLYNPSDTAKRWSSPYFRRYPWTSDIIRGYADLRIVAPPQSVFQVRSLTRKRAIFDAFLFSPSSVN